MTKNVIVENDGQKPIQMIYRFLKSYFEMRLEESSGRIYVCSNTYNAQHKKLYQVHIKIREKILTPYYKNRHGTRLLCHGNRSFEFWDGGQRQVKIHFRMHC